MSKYKTDELVDIFKALANSHRLTIYNMLTQCCTAGDACDSQKLSQCCVGDLDSRLNIAPSTLSHHLKELHRANLIDMDRQGKQVFCSLNTDTLTALNHFFQDKSNEASS
jgi:ArsR family transcriptional regulator